MRGMWRPESPPWSHPQSLEEKGLAVGGVRGQILFWAQPEAEEEEGE